LGRSSAACQGQLRRIVGEDAIDAVQFGRSQRFLRLHKLNAFGNARYFLLPRKIKRLLRDFDILWAAEISALTG
jgi:hypothetical protein